MTKYKMFMKKYFKERKANASDFTGNVQGATLHCMFCQHKYSSSKVLQGETNLVSAVCLQT